MRETRGIRAVGAMALAGLFARAAVAAAHTVEMLPGEGWWPWMRLLRRSTPLRNDV